jgi:shikimate dehydrogenase
MPLFGLIGYPLSHSFSKKYFTEKFEREGLNNYRYENFPIASIDEVRKIFEENPDLQGLNVTIPYKEQILPFLHESSAEVAQIGACNCVKIIAGKNYGFNTDVIGFEETLNAKLLPHHRKALVLGSGGASKAIQFVLKKKAIDFLVVSRSKNPLFIPYEKVTPELIKEYMLIINTTPLGMQPLTDNYPSIPYFALTAQHYLYDLIYNPAKTLFLQKGEESGAVIQNGADMLSIQAEESWKIWNTFN